MAAVTAPAQVAAKHQSLLHLLQSRPVPAAVSIEIGRRLARVLASRSIVD
jgi:hypothetical protein